MSGDGDSRKRLRPWLEAKINGGTIPGLEWVDAEKTMFTIPWKHAGKQDWTPDQSVLFMVRMNCTNPEIKVDVWKVISDLLRKSEPSIFFFSFS